MSQKIQFCSDLHLEFRENNAYIKSNPLHPKAPILLLAGDIVPFEDMHKHKDFFSYIADNFETSYWLPGNHEYYNNVDSKRFGSIHEKIRSNVSLVNNITTEHGDVTFAFSTLWTRISPANEWLIKRSMNDFNAIKYNGSQLGIEKYNELHDDCLAYLKSTLESKKNDKTVVVSHHIPTMIHYPEQYKGSAINEAFAIELHDFIEATNPSCWIYGHHHCNIPEFKIGNTRMCTNQLGYVRHGEHKEFNNVNTIIV